MLHLIHGLTLFSTGCSNHTHDSSLGSRHLNCQRPQVIHYSSFLFFPLLIHATQRWKGWSNDIIICKVKYQYGPSSRLHTAFNPKAAGIDSRNFPRSVKDSTRVCVTLYLNGSHVDAIYALCQHWSLYGSGWSCAKFLDASMAGWGYTCGVALCGAEEAGKQCAGQQHAAR